MLPANAPAWIDRLLTWLEPFESAFGHVAQRGAFRRYLLGLLSDSPRKSMSAMLTRVSDPDQYQALQHCMTSTPWSADGLWRQLRRRVPAREGVLILDGTSFPEQGDRSVVVARQYCGALGKIATCQVATTVALWTGAQAWIPGARLYLPDTWLTPEARRRARIPATVRFQEQWRHALRLFQQIRAARFRITAVLADAEFGDNSTVDDPANSVGGYTSIAVPTDPAGHQPLGRHRRDAARDQVRQCRLHQRQRQHHRRRPSQHRGGVYLDRDWRGRAARHQPARTSPLRRCGSPSAARRAAGERHPREAAVRNGGAALPTATQLTLQLFSPAPDAAPRGSPCGCGRSVRTGAWRARRVWDRGSSGLDPRATPRHRPAAATRPVVTGKVRARAGR